MFESYADHIQHLKDTGKHRKLQENLIHDCNIDFSTNDYLCLSKNKKIIESACDAGWLYGFGATGSRLLSGNRLIFSDLERQIAIDKNTDAALVFNSGFQANFSVLSALLDTRVLKSRPIVFFDKLNHSSLYQAIFLSNPELLRYRHNDMSHLEELLFEKRLENRPKFIVTETVFGMDGDISPIDALVTLARKHDALLYLDEAHATGVFGKNGYGISTLAKEISSIKHVLMGTFSKAIGGSGGYIASSEDVIEYIVNKAPGFIYSTAMSPMIAAGVLEAWKIIPTLQDKVLETLSLAQFLRDKLMDMGFDVGSSKTHIVPVIIGNEKEALALKDALFSLGIICSCIRPPTVPPGTSRLRFALNIGHSVSDIKYLTECMRRI